MNVTYKDATITNTDDTFPGSFEVILSTPAKDRDGDTLRTEDWKQPLPEHITFDADHGMSVASTVGSGVPSIEGGNLIVRGTYSSLPRAQEVRTLVNEGHIRTTSVAFMTERYAKSGTGRPDAIRRELLNGAFVAIPSNREAAVLASKSATPSPMEVFAKAGARNSKADAANIQAAHDALVAVGATCAPMDDTGAEEGAVGGKTASPDFKPLADGTHVTWHYRGAIGHGTIVGVHHMGTSHATTEYSIAEHDHHVSATGSHERPVVYHYGSALTVVSGGKAAADVETKDVHTPAQMAKAIDASLDGAQNLIATVDPSTLPEPIQQAIGLITAAEESVDALLDTLGVTDPDDTEDGETTAAEKSADADALEMQFRAMTAQLNAVIA